MSHSPTRMLVVRAQRGDADALGQLLEQVLPDVERVVRKTLGHPLRAREATMDIVQDGVALFLGSADANRFEGVEELRRCVVRYARYALGHRAEYWQRGKRDVRRREEVEVDALQSAPGHHDEDAEFVDFFLGLLGEDRVWVELNMLEGLAYAEIAERMGLASAEAARKRCSRAFAKLGELAGVYGKQGLTAVLYRRSSPVD